MRAIFQTLRAVADDGLRLFVLPFAHVADDRIQTFWEYERHLDWSEKLHQSGRRWSLLSILKRAARRQEKLNAVGWPRFIQLQRHARERWFAWWFHIRIILFFLAIGYTGDALEHILGDHFPLLFTLWLEGLDCIDAFYYWFWHLLPGPGR